ncbi:MAG: ABC transporter ATP-binding protein [Clostridiales bacterium]|nr:ABC transporter ATP-binding protein [Clostridiales bacterium]
MTHENKLIEVTDLKVSFYHESGKLQVVRGFDMSVEKGKIIGILGESGSGKTVSATSILKLEEDDVSSIDSGEVIFKGLNLMELSESELRKIRGNRISYIFQNASSALNPFKSIGKQLTEVLKNHKLAFSKELVLQALVEVGIEDTETVYDMYPFQLSGGQNQRIMIAQCIISRPDLLIADEPTSSIDASLRKIVLDLLKEINKKNNMSIIIITHDFDVAKYLCDRLVIMYGGLVVEEGPLNEIFANPFHPYTKELIVCAGSLKKGDEIVYTLEGSPPSPFEFADECPFAKRCKVRLPECTSEIPRTLEISGRKVRCIRYEKR